MSEFAPLGEEQFFHILNTYPQLAFTSSSQQ